MSKLQSFQRMKADRTESENGIERNSRKVSDEVVKGLCVVILLIRVVKGFKSSKNFIN